MIVSINPDEVQCIIDAVYFAAPRLNTAEKVQLNAILSRIQNELAAQRLTSSLQAQVPAAPSGDQSSSSSSSTGGEGYQRSDISQSTLNGSSG